MGKRYYCDYCDKSFADNPVNRKLHLTGGIHIHNKKAHYDAVKDEREILQDDLHKKPCRAFMNSGDCRFGERCQYSHLTSEDKARLSKRITKKQKAAQDRENEKKKTLVGLGSSLDEWLEQRAKKLKEREESEEGSGGGSSSSSNGEGHERKQQVDIPDYQLPDCLKVFPSLPPSLLPPSKDNILYADYSEWG